MMFEINLWTRDWISDDIISFITGIDTGYRISEGGWVRVTVMHATFFPLFMNFWVSPKRKKGRKKKGGGGRPEVKCQARGLYTPWTL